MDLLKYIRVLLISPVRTQTFQIMGFSVNRHESPPLRCQYINGAIGV